MTRRVHIPAHQAGALAARQRRRGRIPSKKVEIDGITFDSKTEARRYHYLKTLERAGEVYGLEVHPEYIVEVNGVKVCTYHADFRYWRRSDVCRVDPVVEDVKSKGSKLARDWPLRKRLVEAAHGIEITEVVM